MMNILCADKKMIEALFLLSQKPGSKCLWSSNALNEKRRSKAPENKRNYISSSDRLKWLYLIEGFIYLEQNSEGRFDIYWSLFQSLGKKIAAKDEFAQKTLCTCERCKGLAVCITLVHRACIW